MAVAVEVVVVAAAVLGARALTEHLEDLLLDVERLGGRLAVVGAAVELGGIAVLGGAAQRLQSDERPRRRAGVLQVVDDEIEHLGVRALHLRDLLLDGEGREVDVEARLDHQSVALDARALDADRRERLEVEVRWR